MSDATPVGSAANKPAISGHLERISGNDAIGWVFDDTRPDTAVHVGLRVSGVVIGTGLANLPRLDLQQAGLGEGAHGFRIPLEIPFNSGQRVEVELFDTVSGASIAALPFVLHCRDPIAVNANELDSQSVHGLIPPRRSRGRRRAGALVSPLIKPIKRLKNYYAARSESAVADGVSAKLSRVETMSVTSRADAACWPALTLPVFDASDTGRHPRVSIIIPVYNQFQLTYQCLMSLILSGDYANREVIVVDDASTDASAEIESRVENLRVVRNEKNLGFLHSCNKAAALARGDYIVFLNNDTEVGERWVDRMLDVFQSFMHVGAVGSKLLYPDGSLQDAGGIVWESGTPWNVGHGKQGDDPEYNYVREVDYLTGAALMVSREAWSTVGGFSEQYAPAYYEDTDLAFKLRAAGYKTLYCPQSVVVHYEGRSNGTDTGCGVKQHQVINAKHFKKTWKQAFIGQGAEGVNNLRRQKDRNRGLRVLMVDNSFPRLGQDAGSYAAIQELKLLLSLNCKVTFLPNNLLHLGVHVEYLQSLGVECVHVPFHRSVPKFMERRAAEFDVVYVTRYAVAEKIIPLVRQFSSAKVIFNNADLHFLREMRTALAAGKDDLALVDETRRRELSVMKLADAVLSYSDIELEIIASHLLRKDKLFRCPWVLKPEHKGKPFQSRRGLAFLGGYGHPPNRVAMDWFVQHVMPLLHAKRPGLELHIWGSHVPENCTWGEQPGVVLEGYAETLDDVFSGIVAFVAPLQAGAGIKGKVLDSVAYGVPTILSPVAVEATGLVHASSTLIAHSAEQWVSHVECLLDDQELWENMRRASIELRDTLYSHEHGVDAFRQMFDYLCLDTTIVQQQVRSEKLHG